MQANLAMAVVPVEFWSTKSN